MTLESIPHRNPELALLPTIEHRLEGELTRFRATTPRSAAEWERAKQRIPFGVGTNFRTMEPYPVYIRRAEGSHVEDLDGHLYIDYLLGQTTMITGHAHPVVLEAARRQMSNGTMTCYPSPLTADLAEVVCERFRLERVRFVNTGAEATYFSARVARAATGRDMILKFDINYHGSGPEFMIGKAMESVGPDSPSWLGSALWTSGVPKSFTDQTVVSE